MQSSRSNRFWWASPLVLALLVSSAGCPGRGTRRDVADAVVILESSIDDAEVWVDGRFVREIRELRRGISLPTGEHRIEVRHSDYHASYFEVSLAPRARVVLDARLAPRLP